MKAKVLMTAALAAAIGLAWPAIGAPKAAAEKHHAPVKRDAPPRASRFHRTGHAVAVLPAGHVSVRIGSKQFFYHGGIYFQRRGDTYVVVNAPIGARVRTLPPGHATWIVGGRRYFYVNATFYLWDADRNDYVVVERPESIPPEIDGSVQTVLSQMVVYPAAGQSDEQRRQDRFECHLWAVDESGADPTLGDGDAADRGHYERALIACLEGRGYVVG